MTVLLLIIAMLAQVVQNATMSIQRSTKGMDNNQLSTIALDRIGNSIAGMVSSGQGTLVAVKNQNGSDGLVMITNGRVRSRTSVSSISVSDFSNIRLGARGYCVATAPDPDLSIVSGAYPTVPMLHWGDGTIAWKSPASQTANVQGDPLQALSLGLTDVLGVMGGGSVSDAKMLQFDPLSRSIFRFEICFLLSDGSIICTTTPPLNQHFIVGGTPPVAPFTLNPTAMCYPLAFNSQDARSSNSPTTPPPVFVRAIVVGIASLDAATMKILSNNQLDLLGKTTTFAKVQQPAPDSNNIIHGQTPLEAWDISGSGKTTYQNLTSSFPPPVLQNIRFSQRYFYVN